MFTNEFIVKSILPVAKNISDPTVIYDDFDSGNGYFNEENGECKWHIENGMLRTSPKDCESLAYIHVFEQNVKFRTRIRINEFFSNQSEFSLLTRYNAEDAWIRVNYQKHVSMWNTVVREGRDFPIIRYRRDLPQNAASLEVYKELEAGKWYDICVIADGSTVTCTVDGEELFVIPNIPHLSPGRVGIRCRDISLDVDSFELTLLSGQGTVIKNVKHTKLPDEVYREGGSVFEMKDGTLIYTHHSKATFESKDNGFTWSRREQWTDTYGYVNILRLNNGDFMKIAYKKEDDGATYVISQTSQDDGKTWFDGGHILRTPYRGNTTAHAGNMNDKLNQSGTTGRIFYSQNYECVGGDIDGRIVFCEFYYSDDNGKTWVKSETDSWNIPGNENQIRFGECKILECDDGSLRMYNSWNMYGCVVYSESFDGGATWGELKKIPWLVTPCASMQFYRDPYADNPTTYYMVWVYCAPEKVEGAPMPRNRLALAKSTNGKDWHYLGDLWRWETPYGNPAPLAHVVDAFIKTTKEYVICGAGFCEHMMLPGEKGCAFHNAQRQHVYSIPKKDLDAVPFSSEQ